MTQEIKLPKAVKRVTIVQADGASSAEVYRAKDKEKKQTKGLRMLEKLTRRNAKASETFAQAYTERHRRSNRKRRDGWLRDLAVNVFKASGKAGKSFRLSRLFGF